MFAHKRLVFGLAGLISLGFSYSGFAQTASSSTPEAGRDLFEEN